MAHNFIGNKYTISTSLISLLLQGLSTNAAPFEQPNRRAAWGEGGGWGNSQISDYKDGVQGGRQTSWDKSGSSMQTSSISFGQPNLYLSGSILSSPTFPSATAVAPTANTPSVNAQAPTPSTQSNISGSTLSTLAVSALGQASTSAPDQSSTTSGVPLAVTFVTVATSPTIVVSVAPVSGASQPSSPSAVPVAASSTALDVSAVPSATPSTVPAASVISSAIPSTSPAASVVPSATPSTLPAPSTGSPGVFAQGASTLETVNGSSAIQSASSVASQSAVISQSVAGVFAETLSSNTISPTDSPTVKPATKGSIGTGLPSGGNPSSIPFPTTVVSTTSATISPTSINGTASRTLANPLLTGSNIFVPISSDAAPAQIVPKGGHPVPRTGISDNITTPIETNKFYGSLFLAAQTDSVWTHPYSVRWAKGVDNIKSWGMAISHIDRSQVTFGPGTPAQYYVNPIGIDSLVLSALEFGSSTVLTTDNHEAFSVNAHLAVSAGASPLLTLPLVQGMGFVTGIYTGCTPLIQSGVFFKTLSPLSVSNGISKTTATLQDGNQWVIYVIPNNSKTSPDIILNDSQTIQISSGFSGIIQVAKLAGGSSAVANYDSSAGVYAVGGAVSGTIISSFTVSVTGTSTSSYSISWTKQGDTSKTLLMFALPHHVESFDATTAPLMTNITLQTTTKGMATALLADSWTMIEQLPTNMTFAPFLPATGSVTSLPAAAVSLIAQTAAEELGEDISAQTDLDTMYFSGKALAKFAAIVYTAHDLANSQGIAAAGLVKLEAALEVFIQNKQVTPLVYDTVWKGAVSSAGYTDINADYGGTAYNDHHFHYGYFVYTAAVIGYLDPTWLTTNGNKAWVNMLVRDFANSATDDPYFPFSRSFDWFMGHSWAKGLFESGAGKDQESTSEDTFASYALKMWGKVSGDANMEARGNLMLAIQARSLNNYFLMESTNKVQPAEFIDNKVSGILFEDKLDHTTYFGTNIEYIEGIHMLPLMPNSALTRSKTFVQEEWTKYFDNNRWQVAGGWRGILMANLALIDPKTSWNFFADANFDPTYLDGGASRTWYLAFAAALGGVS